MVAALAATDFFVKRNNNMNRDQEAKPEFIKSFHENADQRIEVLLWLNNHDHQQEALTLCLSYIDSFSQWLCWPSTKSGENFVQAIIDFGNEPLMGLVHPLQAIRTFEGLKLSWRPIVRKIESIFPGPEFELISRDEFLRKLASHLSPEEVKRFKAECWRGTLAATAYYYLRNPSIHSFGALELSFSKTTYKGKIIGGMGFIALHSIAKNLHAELRRRSESNIQWFGNDKIVGA